jgi:hydrogenase maturation factor
VGVAETMEKITEESAAEMMNMLNEIGVRRSYE